MTVFVLERPPHLVQLEEYAGRRLVKVVFVVGRARIPGRCVYVARLALRGALIEGAVLARVCVLLVVVHCGEGQRVWTVRVLL